MTTFVSFTHEGVTYDPQISPHPTCDGCAFLGATGVCHRPRIGESLCADPNGRIRDVIWVVRQDRSRDSRVVGVDPLRVARIEFHSYDEPYKALCVSPEDGLDVTMTLASDNPTLLYHSLSPRVDYPVRSDMTFFKWSEQKRLDVKVFP